MEKAEMMKRYEAETGQCAERRVWHEREFLTDDYIAWLEAQLRWRPVSEELPSVEKDGAAIIASYKDVDKGRVPIDCVSTIWFLNNYKIWFTHWLPIPPAPEGE